MSDCEHNNTTDLGLGHFICDDCNREFIIEDGEILLLIIKEVSP